MKLNLLRYAPSFRSDYPVLVLPTSGLFNRLETYDIFIFPRKQRLKFCENRDNKMKFQSLISVKKKLNISMLSAESLLSMPMRIKTVYQDNGCWKHTLLCELPFRENSDQCLILLNKRMYRVNSFVISP